MERVMGAVAFNCAHTFERSRKLHQYLWPICCDPVEFKRGRRAQIKIRSKGAAFFVMNTYIVVFSDQSKLARIRPSVLKLVRNYQRGAEVRQQKVDLIIPVCDKLNPEWMTPGKGEEKGLVMKRRSWAVPPSMATWIGTYIWSQWHSEPKQILYSLCLQSHRQGNGFPMAC